MLAPSSMAMRDPTTLEPAWAVFLKSLPIELQYVCVERFFSQVLRGFSFMSEAFLEKCEYGIVDKALLLVCILIGK
jgi:hypothetical protein